MMSVLKKKKPIANPERPQRMLHNCQNWFTEIENEKIVCPRLGLDLHGTLMYKNGTLFLSLD